jgi:SOS-response transcriptional repressor LexA
MTTPSHQSVDVTQVDRPTRERLLIALYEDEQQQRRRTLNALALYLRIAPSSINGHLNKLQTAGLVQKQGHGEWELTPAGRTKAQHMVSGAQLQQTQENGLKLHTSLSLNEIPLVGLIAAGDPIEMVASTLLDALAQGKLLDLTVISLPTVQFPGTDSQHHFAMTVRGDSMEHVHICEGDTVIFRYASGWEGWDNVRRGDIIAAAVPEGANVEQEDWLTRTLAGEFATDLDRRYITLKQFDGTLYELVGRYGRIKTTYRPVGVLEFVVRQYQNDIRKR